jgi:Transposase and inactivated derivatives
MINELEKMSKEELIKELVAAQERAVFLEEQASVLEQRAAELELKYQRLQEAMIAARKKQFGSSSEQSKYSDEQLHLFNEAEEFAAPEGEEQEPEIDEVEVAEAAPKRRKRGPRLTSKIDKSVEVEVIRHELSEEERVCAVCDTVMEKMGEEIVREEVKLIPARIVIVQHVRVTYSCPECETNGISASIKKAPVSKAFFEKSFATPEALAYIATEKFVKHVPLYRQETTWAYSGIPLTRQTMSNWLIKACEVYFAKLYEAMKRKLLQEGVLHADETVLQVLREPGKAPQSKSRMFVYCSGGSAGQRMVLYEYQPNRKAEHIRNFLGGWKGYLHSDGYGAYHTLSEGVVVVGCLAHIRRYFHNAMETLAKEARGSSRAKVGREYCDKLFKLERGWEGLSPEERYIKRQECAKPILDEFLSWLKSTASSVGSGNLGKAIKYALNQWPWFINYLHDGRVEISNNRAENAIRPFVIGRKNFLFANTPKGAQASAMLFSVIETAKANDLDPYKYLVFVLTELSKGTDHNYEDYIPGGSRVPDSCRIPRADEDKRAVFEL